MSNTSTEKLPLHKNFRFFVRYNQKKYFFYKTRCQSNTCFQTKENPPITLPDFNENKGKDLIRLEKRLRKITTRLSNENINELGRSTNLIADFIYGKQVIVGFEMFIRPSKIDEDRKGVKFIEIVTKKAERAKQTRRVARRVAKTVGNKTRNMGHAVGSFGRRVGRRFERHNTKPHMRTWDRRQTKMTAASPKANVSKGVPPRAVSQSNNNSNNSEVNANAYKMLHTTFLNQGQRYGFGEAKRLEYPQTNAILKQQEKQRKKTSEKKIHITHFPAGRNEPLTTRRIPFNTLGKKKSKKKSKKKRRPKMRRKKQTKQPGRLQYMENELSKAIKKRKKRKKSKKRWRLWRKPTHKNENTRTPERLSEKQSSNPRRLSPSTYEYANAPLRKQSETTATSNDVPYEEMDLGLHVPTLPTSLPIGRNAVKDGEKYTTQEGLTYIKKLRVRDTLVAQDGTLITAVGGGHQKKTKSIRTKHTKRGRRLKTRHSRRR